MAAGHVIECGTQATGGNYSFFTELPGLDHTGFPWAEVAVDGSSVIGKHDHTGGVVTVATVTAQLLYEVGAPAYLGPDVTTRFDTIELEQVAPDRVQMSGIRGEPPPPTLKVAMNSLGGFRRDLRVALTGLDIEEKAALVDAAFWRACPREPTDFAEVTSAVVRTDKGDPMSNEEATASWHLTLKDPDEGKLGRELSAAVNELALATIPGMYALDAGPARAFGVYRPARVPAALVPQHVVVLGAGQTVVESTAPVPDAPVIVEVPSPGLPAAPDGPTSRLPIGRVIGTRSGDKGGDANLGVFTRDSSTFAWIDQFLTTDRLRTLLPETAGLVIERHRLPNLWSLNFVIRGLLQQGVAASTRQDGQAKSLGEWLRARVVDIPEVLIR